MRIPVVSKGITLTEIPDEIAVYFELGNCQQRCEGCHSPHLTEPLSADKGMLLAGMIDYAIDQKNRGATAIVLMGGTCNGIPLGGLLVIIRELHYILPVGLYSGLSEDDISTDLLMNYQPLKWFKTGSYLEEYGGLGSQTTNQKFYQRNFKGQMVDFTWKFKT